MPVVSLLGLFIFLGVLALVGRSFHQIPWRTVGVGLLLQFGLGLIILRSEFGRNFFEVARWGAQGFIDFSLEGALFLFGDLARSDEVGPVFATMVLPTIVFVSSLTAVLYHWGILQKVVSFFARVMVRLMGTSGAESLAAAANVFAGQTEAPLVVRPYLKTMTESELLALMSGGMATVAGGVLAAYVGMGVDAGHLLAASVMSAPAALVCAKVLCPETGSSDTQGRVQIALKKDTLNVVDAAARGASEGMKLAINVAAMLMAFIALVAMVNQGFLLVGDLLGVPGLTFDRVVGLLFSPIAFLMGVPWQDCRDVGQLLAKKIIFNEFVAYTELQAAREGLSERAEILATYALCGFANISSVAIQVGGIGALEPARKQDLAKLGLRALLAGSAACFMTACIAGILMA